VAGFFFAGDFFAGLAFTAFFAGFGADLSGFARSSAASRDATVGAFRDVDLRLLSQTFSLPISSTFRFETTERGATAVTSTSAFANWSRCLSSSHSFPLSDFDRPPIFTSAHSPNIFLPARRNVSLPERSALTGSSPGSMNSHVPWSQMMTLPAP
jgi:hypothetical protein